MDDVIAVAGMDRIPAVAGGDVVVTAAGGDDIIAVAGYPPIVAVAGNDDVVAAANGDVIVAAADGNVYGVIARDGQVVNLVRAAEVDGNRTTGRRGEHEGVARERGGRGCGGRIGKAVIAHQQITAAGVLDDLDVRQRIRAGADDAAVDHPMARLPVGRRQVPA